MSDRLAVMSNGVIAQLGSPREVYDEPVDAYVADFLGVSNLMEATVVRPASGGNPCLLKVGDSPLESLCGSVTATGDVRVSIRPERVRVEAFELSGKNLLPGMVERVVFLGSTTQLIVRLAAGFTLQALVSNDGGPDTLEQGTPVKVGLPPDALRVLAGGVSIEQIHEETFGDRPAHVARQLSEPTAASPG